MRVRVRVCVCEEMKINMSYPLSIYMSTLSNAIILSCKVFPLLLLLLLLPLLPSSSL